MQGLKDQYIGKLLGHSRGLRPDGVYASLRMGGGGIRMALHHCAPMTSSAKASLCSCPPPLPPMCPNDVPYDSLSDSPPPPLPLPLQWSPDNWHLASGGNDNHLYVWSAQSSSPMCKFRWERDLTSGSEAALRKGGRLHALDASLGGGGI